MNFESILKEYSPSMIRLCQSYEYNAEKRQELNQEIWTAIWRSLQSFKEECTLRTWIFRVAHNVAITYSTKEALSPDCISLEEFLDTQFNELKNILALEPPNVSGD